MSLRVAPIDDPQIAGELGGAKHRCRGSSLQDFVESLLFEQSPSIEKEVNFLG